MGFSPCLSRKRPYHGLGVRLRSPFPPACRGKSCFMGSSRAKDHLFTLPVEEKGLHAVGDNAWCSLCVLFPLPDAEKAIVGLGVRLRWPFPSACRGKGHHGTWRALAIAFPSCLSRKRLFHGLGSRLRWPFPPACRGKDRLMDFVRICDGLFPLPVEEKAVSWTLLPLCDCLFHLREKEKASFRFPRRHPREASRGPRKWPGSSRAKKLSILTIFVS